LALPGLSFLRSGISVNAGDSIDSAGSSGFAMPNPVALARLGFPGFVFDRDEPVVGGDDWPRRSAIRAEGGRGFLPLRVKEGGDASYFVVYVKKRRLVYARAVLFARSARAFLILTVPGRAVVHHYDYVSFVFADGEVARVADDTGRLAWMTRAEHARLHRLGL